MVRARRDWMDAKMMVRNINGVESYTYKGGGRVGIKESGNLNC